MQGDQGRESKADDEETAGDMAGLDHVGDDDSSQLPEDDVSIRLPIEEGDFDAQPR